MAMLAVLCYCNDIASMHAWCTTEEDWLKTYIPMPFGVPSEDTFRRVLRMIKPSEMQKLFSNWVKECLPQVSGHIALDGKTIAGTTKFASGDNERNYSNRVHTVSAYSCIDSLVLKQDFTGRKGGELAAGINILKFFDLGGTIVTADAGFCYRSMADAVIESHGSYLFRLKGNQRSLNKEVKELSISDSEELSRRGIVSDTYDVEEKGKGRIEIRNTKIFASDEPIKLHSSWNDIRTVIVVDAHRKVLSESKESTQRRFYISSAKLDAEEAHNLIRAHWKIESGLHYILDDAYNEDRSRLREKNLAMNMNILRQFTLNILKLYDGDKRSLVKRRFQALLVKDYRISLLSNALARKITM